MVNLDISDRYQRALGRLQESWVENESLDVSEARITGGEEQRMSKEPEGPEEQAKSGVPSAVQKPKESGGKGGRREYYMKKKVPELKKLLKCHSKPWTGKQSELVDRLLDYEQR